MTADRIERLDAHGEPFEVLTGVALRFELGSTMKEGVLVGLMPGPTSSMVTFDEDGAAEVAALLLEAAGPEGVGEALARCLPAVLSEDLHGCGDHSCAVAKPRGMGTNGHCRCDERTLRRALRRERAAKVDIVGAARDVLGSVAAISHGAAMKRLAAELAKLEGGP
jgi:hypothetical protein